MDAKITCIVCGCELTDNPTGPERDFDMYFTSSGTGPYCAEHYIDASWWEDFPHESDIDFDKE